MNENTILSEIFVSHVATGDMSKEIKEVSTGDYLKDDYVGLIEYGNKIVLINRMGDYITPSINNIREPEVFFPIPVYKAPSDGFASIRQNGNFMASIKMVDFYTNKDMKLTLEKFIGSSMYDNEWVNKNVKKLIAYLTNNQSFLKIM